MKKPSEEILSWSTHYRKNNMGIPDRIALTENEIKALRAEFEIEGLDVMRWPDGSIQIFGLWTEIVGDFYAGPRVWASKKCGHCNGSGLKPKTALGAL